MTLATLVDFCAGTTVLYGMTSGRQPNSLQMAKVLVWIALLVNNLIHEVSIACYMVVSGTCAKKYSKVRTENLKVFFSLFGQTWETRTA